MRPPETSPSTTPTSALWLIVAFGIALRLIVAHVWIGSTDVKRWLFFSSLSEDGA